MLMLQCVCRSLNPVMAVEEVLSSPWLSVWLPSARFWLPHASSFHRPHSFVTSFGRAPHREATSMERGV